MLDILSSVTQILVSIKEWYRNKRDEPQPRIELISSPWSIRRYSNAPNKLTFQNNGNRVTLLAIEDPDGIGITAGKGKCILERRGVFSVACPDDIIKSSRGKRVVLKVRDSYFQKYLLTFTIKEGFPTYSVKKL